MTAQVTASMAKDRRDCLCRYVVTDCDSAQRLEEPIRDAARIDWNEMTKPAFKLLEEAQLFCQRHFPLLGKIVPGKLQRVDTPLIPPDAMREILVNAFIHRDYSIIGGAISLAIFDDRVEVWSAGTYPAGITPEMLTRQHLSVLRNPIIADIFHRAGLIEKWGRGTNRVTEMCREAGIAPPQFEEITGAAVVTFKVNVRGGRPAAPQAAPDVAPQVMRLLSVLKGTMDRRSLQKALKLKTEKNFRMVYLRPALDGKLIEMTIPGKPQSSNQRYRLTAMGKAILEKEGVR